jgi:hypothetical protein
MLNFSFNLFSTNRQSIAQKERAAFSKPFEGLVETRRRRIAELEEQLGTALASLGARESGTARLEQAVSAYREALKECTKEAAPYWHDIAHKNLDRANTLLAQRRKG